MTITQLIYTQRLWDLGEWFIKTFGALVCYRSERVRVHYWSHHPDVRIDAHRAIHSHGRAMTVEVMSGRTVHTEYVPTQYHRGGRYAADPRIRCDLETKAQTILRAGSSYWMSPSCIHQVEYDEGTLTVVTLGAVESKPVIYREAGLGEPHVKRPVTRDEFNAIVVGWRMG